MLSKLQVEPNPYLQGDVCWSQHRQTGHTGEMTFILCQQRQIMFKANGGNQHILDPDIFVAPDQFVVKLARHGERS